MLLDRQPIEIIQGNRMKFRLFTENNSLYWRLKGDILKVEPWGADGVRVRATNLSNFPEIPGALLETLPISDTQVTLIDDKGILTNGKIRAEIWSDGTLHLFNSVTGAIILEEPEPIFNKPPARWYRPHSSSL